MAAPLGLDPWVITAQERARYEEQFRSLKPVSGIVTGDQAKGFFLQSQLPPLILGKIWALADTDADGKMNISEFSIACKLINLKLRGFEIPKALPPVMLQQTIPPAGLINATILQSAPPPVVMPTQAPLLGMSAPLVQPSSSVPISMIPPMPPVRPQVPTVPAVPVAPTIGTTPPLVMPASAPSPVPVDLALGPMRNGNVVMGQGTLPTKIGQGSSAPAIPTMERVASLDSPMSIGSPLQEWSVPHQSKLKFTQVFNTTDRARSGYLSGPQARNIMIQTQLPQAALAQIWALADMDSDGRLSCEEFVLAMHLCDMAANGEKIPATLPLELIPPTFRRQRQGSLTSGVSGPAEIIDGKEASSSLPTVTFEDKRKENFEKGQAELERRRKALLEIQRKEQEERERKEKEEQEKRERMRQEQERRRQVEFEKQLQRQREAEQEREEQRQRAQEQREAARREMERQRQLEWEKQRSQELQQRRQKEQEKVLQLKAKNQNLGIELSQLNEKVKQLSQKISETRIGVSGVKTTIDGMRTTRDAQLAEMSALKARLKEQNQRLVTLSQEKARMDARNKANMAADSANQEQVKLAFSNKQITLKQLRDRLADLEKEIEVKLDDIENNNSQLSELKQQLGQLIQECEQLYSVYEGKRYKILELKGISDKTKDPTDYTSSWGDSGWGATDQTGWDTAPATGWPDTSQTTTAPATNGNVLKYRALYEFVARNADELSFQPGDIILVPVNQNAEPGWLAGELHGHTGWFPESYVEPIDSPVTNGTDSVGFPPDVMIVDSQNKRQLEGIAEVPENVSDNGSVAEVIGEVLPPIQDEMASPTLGQGQKVDNIEAQALYSWQGWKASHLSFSKGDTINVSEQQEHWWYGERSGICGWFPKSYVKLLALNKQPSELNEYCVALYPYQSVESGDLSFIQGETIIVIKKEGDWWTGVIGDRQGIFPANYVQVMTTTDSMIQGGQPDIPIEKPAEAITTQPLAALVSPPTDQQEEIPKETAGTPDFAAMSSASSQGKGKKPEIATVVAPYKATSAEQLDLQRGQLIMIRKKTSTGWWEGELQAKGKKRQVGWFPASYVKLLGGSNRGTPVMQKPEETPPQASSVEKVIALYPYAALNEDELTFEKDDIITVLAKEEASWWRGELNGVSGLFPSNYVGPVSTISISLDPMERKRQDYIQELISTEQVYIDDMAIVHDVFEKPLLQSSVLTQEEIYKIFVNWREILECNYVFLRSLRIRKEMSTGGIIRMIGDILCENLPQMTAYIRFCSCQLNAASFLQHKTEVSPEFKDLVRQCQADPRTKGMPLSSFLIKPMQRITKYPLIIKKILEYTPESHADFQNLEEALYKAEEFCKQVNEGVREKENSDRLEWLQQHVLCDGLEEQLTFNSLTNSLGPRKFLHFGVLHKAKSGKELIAFLMNDFLLLAQGNKSFGSNHLFLFDRQPNIQFKIYKKPLFLNDIAMLIDGEVPEETDSSKLLRLRQLKNGFIHSFIAPTISERNLWTKRLEEAKKNYLETESISLQRQQSKQAQFGACGRILVVVVEGTELKLSGKCEAFCEVSMGSQKNRTPSVMTTANPRWNASMQFLVKDLEEDVLCITVFALGRFCPNEFLGRTEVRVSNIYREKAYTPGPISKTLKLHEVNSGIVVLKLDLHLFRKIR